MTLRALLRKEFRTARGSRLVWSLALVLTVFTVWSVFSFPVPWPSAGGNEPNPAVAWPVILTSWISSLIGTVIPILLGYFSVASESESGSLKVLFGFPVSRREYLLGKFLAWGPVTIGVMLVGFPVTALAIMYHYDPGFVSLPGFGTAVLLTALYGLAWFAIGFGASAIATTRTRAFAGAFGLYLFFTRFWDEFVMTPLFFLVTGRFPGEDDLAPYLMGDPLKWHHVVRRLNPVEAFDATLAHLAGIHDAFAIGVLLIWSVVPPAIGYWRFRERDLGKTQNPDGLVYLPDLPSVTVSVPSLLPDLPHVRPRNPSLVIARKELLTTYRSRFIQAIVVVLSLVVFSSLLANPLPSEMALRRLTMEALSSVIVEVAVPPIVILVGAFAIASEAESGSLRTLLGLPVSRGQVVLGKYLGRGIIVVFGLTVPSVAGAVALVARFGGIAPIPALQATVITILYGLAFLAIALGFSAVTSRDRALAGSFVLFGVFFALWRRLVITPIYVLLNGRVPTDGDLPPVTTTAEVRWHHLLDRLNPIEAYKAATTGVEVLPLAYWLTILSLLAWTVVPIALGYWRFRRRDIS